MTHKTKRLLIILLAFLFLLFVLFLLWWVWKRVPEPSSISKTPVEREDIPREEKQNFQEIIPSYQSEKEAVTESSLQTLATSFVERFGSFSSESDFANIEDVYPLMSTSYQEEMEEVVAKSVAPADYYAITTRVLNIKIETLDEEAGTATVTVSTQREEAIADIQDVKVRYQTIVLTFVKENGIWKVDSALWQ